MLKSYPTAPQYTQPLQSVIIPLVQHCLPEVEESLDILAGLLLDCSTMFKPEHHTAIISAFTTGPLREKICQLVLGDMSMAPFGKLLIALAQVTIEESLEIATNIHQIQMYSKSSIAPIGFLP